MIDVIVQLLELAGALGVFLIGMKMMSEALQRVAGSKLKSLLGYMTSNRFSGVLTGLLITCVIQSSSATTVMVVSFVNAGLMTLVQAIGVVFGANIGTTFTGWLVALLGFKVKLTHFALPAVGIGFALTFVSNAKLREWGEALAGFGLLFLGLGLLKNAVPAIDDPTQLAWVADWSSHGFLSLLLFVGVGTGLTVVLQSSSATMTLTLTLAALGWLPYEVAAAMVLGENIGTTATANLAAIGASTPARRAARAHFLFNIFGVVWALALMKIYLLPVVDALVPGDPAIDFTALAADEEAKTAAAGVVTTHLAAFHTLFNITNTLVMLPMVGVLTRIVTRWVPEPASKAATRFKHISTALVATPELLMAAVGKELEEMTSLCRGMFTDAMTLLKTGPDPALAESIRQREQQTDDLEQAITDLLAEVAEQETSELSARVLTEQVQNAHNLERIADHCVVLVRIAERQHSGNHPFVAKDIKELTKLGNLVEQALDNLGAYLSGGGDPQRAEKIENKIDKVRRKLRSRHIEQLEASRQDPRAALAFLDTITHLEEIGDRTVAIVRRTEATRQL